MRTILVKSIYVVNNHYVYKKSKFQQLKTALLLLLTKQYYNMH